LNIHIWHFVCIWQPCSLPQMSTNHRHLWNVYYCLPFIQLWFVSNFRNFEEIIIKDQLISLINVLIFSENYSVLKEDDSNSWTEFCSKKIADGPWRTYPWIFQSYEGLVSWLKLPKIDVFCGLLANFVLCGHPYVKMFTRTKRQILNPHHRPMVINLFCLVDL